MVYSSKGYAYTTPTGSATMQILLRYPAPPATVTTANVSALFELFLDYGSKVFSDTDNSWSIEVNGEVIAGGSDYKFTSTTPYDMYVIGSKTINIPTSYDSTTPVTVICKINNINALDISSNDMILTTNYTIPKRQPQAPAAPWPAPTVSNVTNSEALISWKTPAANGSPLNNFMVEVSTSSTFAGASLWYDSTSYGAEKETWGTSIVVYGLKHTTKYYARVYASNNVGDSQPSAPSVAFTTLSTIPGLVTGLTSSSVSATSAVVSYVAPVDNGGAAISSYNIKYSTSASFTTSTTVTSTSLSKTLTGLVRNTLYYYRVYAVNVNGQSKTSPNAYFTTLATVPDPPQPPEFTNNVPGSIDLTITPNGDGGSAILYWGLEFSTSAEFAYGSVYGIEGTDFAFPHQITHFANGTTYYTRALVKNIKGWSARSSVTTVTTVAGPPNGVAKVDKSDITQTSAVLSWATTIFDGGSPITGYAVEVNGYVEVASEPPYTVTGLTPGTSNYIRVAAINEFGTGDFSPYITVITLAIPELTGLLGIGVDLRGEGSFFEFDLAGVLPMSSGLTLVGLSAEVEVSGFIPARMKFSGLTSGVEIPATGAIGAHVLLADVTPPELDANVGFEIGLIGNIAPRQYGDQLSEPDLFDIEHTVITFSPITEETDVIESGLEVSSGVGLPTALTLEAVIGRSGL